ncbi:MAG: tetratricopeptide repeat protein, partial [Bradyrhizobium guangdongense]
MQSSAGARAFQNARLQKKFKKQADAIISSATAAYGQGRYAETEALCRQILNELPEHFGALHLLGLSAFASQNFELAKQAFKLAATVDPRSADAFANLGAAHFALGQYEDARTSLEKAIALRPNFPLALANLGNAVLHLSRVEQAI